MPIAAGFGPKLHRRVFGFGDSYTDGSFSIPDPLTKFGYLYQICFNKGWELRNFAVGGTKIADAGHTTNMDKIDAQPWDRIVWLSGYNDMRFYGNNATEIDTYGTLLSAALTKLSAYGCPIILGNCAKMLTASYSQNAPYNLGSDAAALAYSNKLATIAAGFPLVTVVDVNASWNVNGAGFIQGDGVHPTRVGHQAIATVFLTAINNAGL